MILKELLLLAAFSARIDIQLQDANAQQWPFQKRQRTCQPAALALSARTEAQLQHAVAQQWLCQQRQRHSFSILVYSSSCVSNNRGAAARCQPAAVALSARAKAAVSTKLSMNGVPPLPALH